MSTITLKWTDANTLSDGTTAIPPGDYLEDDVFVSTDGGQTYAIAGHVAPGTGSFQFVTTAGAGSQLNFKVQAKDAAGNLGPAALATVTIPTPPLAPIAAPTGLTASVS